MSEAIDRVLFDIGGVLGSNGWDREQRARAVQEFALDPTDFQYRHEETVGALESGQITLDEYLHITVFCSSRSFTPQAFKDFMFSQSVPFPESVAVARALSQRSTQMVTLNNEAEALNVYRIERFGLSGLFSAFFSSCWMGTRKPTRQIYERALGMLQADPHRCLFIDDRLQNLAPASALGMHTIHFQTAEQLAAELGALGLM